MAAATDLGRGDPRATWLAVRSWNDGRTPGGIRIWNRHLAAPVESLLRAAAFDLTLMRASGRSSPPSTTGGLAADKATGRGLNTMIDALFDEKLEMRDDMLPIELLIRQPKD